MTLCSSACSSSEVFLTSHTGVDLEVPASFRQWKGTCYSKFLFTPEFSATESIKKKRAMGALPVSILISKSIIVPAREERKKKTPINSYKTKNSTSLLFHFGRSVWELDKVLVLVSAEDLCRVPAGWTCWPLLWIPKPAMNFTILISVPTPLKTPCSYSAVN